jgi:NitT/TauT family transport system ATP-binding protein
MHEYTHKETLINLSDVHLELGGNTILSGLNAKIKNVVRPGMSQGQVISFLGPSGVGKTQTFLLLSGLREPTKGMVTITEKNIPVEAGMVGVVTQDYRLFPHRTVMGNLLVSAWHSPNYQTNTATERATQMLERFGMQDHAKKYPRQLSGGQRQRVAIMQQLLCSEHYLLMDEPFSGLDPIAKEQVIELILEVSAQNELNTIIVTTHDIPSAARIADTVWLMGRDQDEIGQVIPGAKIKEVFDLIAMGLAWNPGIHRTKQFTDFVWSVEDKFKTL